MTTNSITQEFSRRVIARHLAHSSPSELGEDPGLSFVLAIPDYPWTKATKEPGYQQGRFGTA